MNDPNRIIITETYRMVNGRCFMTSSLNPGKEIEVPVFLVDPSLVIRTREDWRKKQEYAPLKSPEEHTNLNPLKE